MTTSVELREPPRVSGGEGTEGHLDELRTDPIALLERVRAECGDIGTFRLADRDVVLLSGAEANELFFRAPEEVLDQAEAYPFMTPVFGEGVVFDASPERRREMLHNQALRDKFMRGHAATIAAEVEDMVSHWDDEGEIDAFGAELVDRFGPLPIEVRHLLDVVAIKALCRRANVAKIDVGPKGAVLSFREDTFANPEGLVAFIREQGKDARVRPDMKVVFFDDWETPEERLKGAAGILRRLVRIAERAKAA